jgi:hypothetical protein
VITAGDAAAGIALQNQIADATAAILLARFTTRPIPEICAMGGITLEDFTQSVAYKEFCGGLTPSQEARIRALPLPQLEALAEALLDFQGVADLEAWLATS